MGRHFFKQGAVITVVCFAAALAVAQEPPKESAPRPMTEAEKSVFSGPDAACQSWTDGCRICRKLESGYVVCSNIGIACQAGKLQCTGQ